MENKKMLLIIDPQNDFISGSLAVEGATEKMDSLVDFVKEEAKNYAVTVITADWHPTNHCSFKENGGIWPPHCVQFTEGARIYNSLFATIMPLGAFVLNKGNLEDKEEYSIMDNAVSSEELVKMILNNGINEIDVAGLVFEFCVAGTVKDGVRLLPNVNFKIFKEFCPILDKKLADEFTKFIEENDRIELV